MKRQCTSPSIGGLAEPPPNGLKGMASKKFQDTSILEASLADVPLGKGVGTMQAAAIVIYLHTMRPSRNVDR
jgi:hypothetical protein